MTKELEKNIDDCLICHAPLVYDQKPQRRECSICHRQFLTTVTCREGHFVCDSCHAQAVLSCLPQYLLQSTETDPVRLFEEVARLPQVHMHGPEHHAIVPCVLLTCYAGSGGRLDDLPAALNEAIRRGRQVPGGSCGALGVCGAAAGAGIFASIVLQSNPLQADVWHLPLQLTSDCLARIAAVGGPRCCKRDSRLAIHAAVQFSSEQLGIAMPTEDVICEYSARNKECIKERCPYYPVSPAR
ncbi:MAG: DUF5714 domain-containing protein [Anaerovoracaceae bacterium]|jgi:hypothetical protein